ncbi:MAG TPA: urate oxidase [Pirellulales bacterium]|jgi:urate oxidase
MHVRLAAQKYGKCSVLLCKVTRHASRHDITELTIDIELEGDFSESYLQGDNRRVIATDTMKNTVYALAAEQPLDDAESFTQSLAAHFLDRNAHVTAVAVRARASTWRRIDSAGAHPHAFIDGGPASRTACTRATRVETIVQGGIVGLQLLKTSDSAFRDFLRDEFTTLPDVDDRIFATVINAHWTFSSRAVDWDVAYTSIVDSMIAVFADHKSLAVQQTLFAMGDAALKSCSAIKSVHLEMQNQHRIPFNLASIGKQNRNEIFITTREPYGLITATLERDK